MKSILAIGVLILNLSIIGLSQEKTTKFYNTDWSEAQENKGKYVREITKIKESVYIVQDYLRKGMKLEMKGYFESIEPLVENGPIEFFDKKGNVIISGKYCHGELCGNWKFNNYPRKNFVAEIDYNFNVQNLVIPDQYYDIPQKMAQFVGGPMEMRKYINEKLIIPLSGIRKGIEGKCLVRFAINEEGKTENIQLIQRCYKDYDKEALRLIKEMPNWEPAEKNGVKTKVSITIPINFKMPQ